MVGHRPRTQDSNRSSGFKRQQSNLSQRFRDHDEEAANGNGDANANGNRNENRRRLRFQDAAAIGLAERRRNELKEQIMDGMKHFKLEGYRKTDDEIKEMANKKVRAFYEGQNERLNDWLEVDALVLALADDVLDSMNPDADQDGYLDRDTQLHKSGGTLEEFLPQEEREKRAKDENSAKWAINVRLHPFSRPSMRKTLSSRWTVRADETASRSTC